MKTRMSLIAAPLALFASQAVAEKWVRISNNDGQAVDVDQDSIARGNNGLVDFDMTAPAIGRGSYGADCQSAVIYPLRHGGEDIADWHDHPFPAQPGTTAAYALQFVCANSR